MTSIQGRIDEMDRDVRCVSGFDELLEIGGSVRDVVRGMMEKTKFEQWH